MKRSTIKDVATLAKVSTMTVSRVINQSNNVNDETRRRVNEAIETLNYRPNLAARRLCKSRSTKTIGVVIPSHRYLFTVDYFLRIMRGLEDAAFECGYDIIIYNTSGKRHHNEVDYDHFFDSGLVDGLIVVAPSQNHWNSIDKLVSRCVPVVLLSSRKDNLNFVDGDNVAGSCEIVKHLIQLGHKRIATITGDLKTSNGVDRLKGYEKALKEHGLTYDHSLIANGEFQLEEGYRGMKGLLSVTPRPTAVFCANDFMAVMAIRASNEIGLKIPDEISIVGYDDNDFTASSHPTLTSVRQPCYEMGQHALKSLLNIINGKQDQIQILLPNEIIFRQSCCREHRILNKNFTFS